MTSRERDLARQQAAEHVVESEDRAVNQDTLAWLTQSPRNVQEYLAIDSLWHILGECAQQNEITSIRERVRSWQLAAAAAVIGLVIATSWVFWGGTSAIHKTGKGEITSFQLSDRSVVFLNVGSEVSARYSDDLREVVLRFGEATFQVARDEERPFVVESGTARITAVGTEFAVRRYPNEQETTVTVLDGQVIVESLYDAVAASKERPASREKTRTESVFIKSAPTVAGQRVLVDDAGGLRSVEITEEDPVAWRRRRLVFNRQPLEAVASEFNRFNTTRIVIDDASLSQLEITAVFEADKPGSFLDFLRSMDGVAVETSADGDAFVRRTSSSQPSVVPDFE